MIGQAKDTRKSVFRERTVIDAVQIIHGKPNVDDVFGRDPWDGGRPDMMYARPTRADSVVAHPAGCPARAFCGCGAARRHHVFVLEAHLGGESWLAYDANSGGHRTRLHARSIAGYTIVNPRA